MRAIWSLTVVAMSMLLVLSSLPIGLDSALAAPPDPDASLAPANQAASDESSVANKAQSAQLDLLPDETDTGQDSPDSDAARLASGFSSIRRRGLEAPVQLRQSEPEAPAEEEADKGDGEPRQKRIADDSESERQTEKKDSPKRSSAQGDIRVWPMRANSYSFTQAFGCTQQIANFYLPDAGCPASAPVVHSGIDLAAPEGTPFYAAASGWVTGSGYDREIGVPNTRIIIQHDGRNEGYSTEYLHWIASFVEVGDYVEAGQQIGEVGSVGYSTGPHLHFSVVDLESGEHIDPVRWLPDEPGSTGYRGIQPKTRAQMRLPAGTTAGVPEWEDPNPPPPPEREEVPESPRSEKAKGKESGKGKGKDRSAKKQERRQERRAEKRAASRDDSADQSSEENSDTAESSDDTVRDGKDKERTKKRERNKDGEEAENADTGEDGGKKNSKDDGGDKSGNGRSNKGRHGNGNGNGHRNGNGGGNNHHNNNRNDDKVKQRETNDNGNEAAPPSDGGDGDNGGEDIPGDDEGATAGGSGDEADAGNSNDDTGAAETDANQDSAEDQTDSETNDETDKKKNRGAVAEPSPETSATQPASNDTSSDSSKKSKRRDKS